jgi:hypothetical protein
MLKSSGHVHETFAQHSHDIQDHEPAIIRVATGSSSFTDR